MAVIETNQKVNEMNFNQMNMKADLYSVQNSTGPNGERYVKAFIGYKADASDPNTKGLTLMSISAEPQVFDSLQIQDFPSLVDIDLTMTRGGQNKLKQHIIAIRPAAKQQPQPSQAKA